MPNVLVIGATGYIGQAVASSLVRSGNHIVYGLARTQEKAKLLSSQEIIPVIGSISDNAEWLDLIRTAPIDVVVDASSAMTEAKHILEDVKQVGKERLDRAAAAGLRSPKLGFVYVSGIWVHGSSPIPTNDLAPVGVPHAPVQPPKLVAWRPSFEQEVITATELDAIVIRPALVYGRAGTIWGAFFGPLVGAVMKGEKEVSLYAEQHSRPPLCHVDDVASGIHAAVDKLPLIAGTGVYPVFDLVTSQESMSDIIDAAAKVLGYHGKINVVEPGDNLFMQAMSTTINCSSSRGRELLGWNPKRFGYVQHMDIFAKAWMTSQS